MNCMAPNSKGKFELIFQTFLHYSRSIIFDVIYCKPTYKSKINLRQFMTREYIILVSFTTYFPTFKSVSILIQKTIKSELLTLQSWHKDLILFYSDFITVYVQYIDLVPLGCCSIFCTGKLLAGASSEQFRIRMLVHVGLKIVDNFFWSGVTVVLFSCVIIFLNVCYTCFSFTFRIFNFGSQNSEETFNAFYWDVIITYDLMKQHNFQYIHVLRCFTHNFTVFRNDNHYFWLYLLISRILSRKQRCTSYTVVYLSQLFSYRICTVY